MVAKVLHRTQPQGWARCYPLFLNSNLGGIFGIFAVSLHIPAEAGLIGWNLHRGLIFLKTDFTNWGLFLRYFMLCAFGTLLRIFTGARSRPYFSLWKKSPLLCAHISHNKTQCDWFAGQSENSKKLKKPAMLGALDLKKKITKLNRPYFAIFDQIWFCVLKLLYLIPLNPT